MRFTFRPMVFIAATSIVLSACTQGGGQPGAKSAGNTPADAQNSADTGNQAADLHLADLHFKGDGVAKDPAEGLRLLHRVASGPYASSRRLANFKLGELNQDGIPGHLTPSRIAALGYFQKSAADHYEPANARLAELARYPDVIVELHRSEFTGRPQGTEPAPLGKGAELFRVGNDAAAFPIFLYHAHNGSVAAQWVVAAMYHLGQGVAVDEMRYKGWCYMAARNGQREAQAALGTEFYLGRILPRSDAEAEIWLTRAAKQGDAEAHRILGLIALDPQDKRKRRDEVRAFRHFEAAAAAGSARAKLHLGGFYLGGSGVPRDRDKARDNYMAAADAGIPEAKALLLEHFNIVHDGKAAKDSRAAAAERSTQPGTTAAAAIPQPRTPPAPIPIPSAPPAPVALAKPTLVELFTKLSPSVVRIVTLNIKGKKREFTGLGSAVAIRPDLVLTNCHVLDDSNTVGTSVNKQTLLFDVIGGDKNRDLCLMRPERAMRSISSTRSFHTLRVGEKVFTIGSPEGLENTISEGIISGLRRDKGIRYIQTSAAIAPGSSGGGLFDENGALIGITTFRIGEGGGNLNFAVAIDESDVLIARFLKKGK